MDHFEWYHRQRDLDKDTSTEAWLKYQARELKVMAKAKKVIPKKVSTKKKVATTKKKVATTKKKVVTNKKVSDKPKSQRKGILSRIESAEDLVDDHKFSIGIFGAPATGKTTFWSTFPKPILAAMCSGGRKRSGEFRSLTKDQKKGIDAIHLSSCDELSQMISEMKSGSKYQTIVLDHLTSFIDLALMQVLGLSEAPAQLGWGTASQENWGEISLVIKGFLRDLMNLEDSYSVIVSHERVFEPPEDSEIGVATVGPAVNPSVANWLVGALDYNIQMFRRDEIKTSTKTIAGKKKTISTKTGKNEFCAFINMHNQRLTKFRSPLGSALPDIVIDPTFQKIKDLMED